MTNENIRGEIGMGVFEWMKENMTTSSSSGVLTEKMLQDAWDKMPKTQPTVTVLIAKNKRMQKKMRKQYPGIQVMLEKDYRGMTYHE